MVTTGHDSFRFGPGVIPPERIGHASISLSASSGQYNIPQTGDIAQAARLVEIPAIRVVVYWVNDRAGLRRLLPVSLALGGYE